MTTVFIVRDIKFLHWIISRWLDCGTIMPGLHICLADINVDILIFGAHYNLLWKVFWKISLIPSLSTLRTCCANISFAIENCCHFCKFSLGRIICSITPTLDCICKVFLMGLFETRLSQTKSPKIT